MEIAIPSYLTILLFCCGITLISGYIQFEYIIALIVFIYFLLFTRLIVKGAFATSIFYNFFAFACWQLIGLIGNFTLYSINNICTTILMMLIICTLHKSNLNISFRTTYYFLTAILIYAVFHIISGIRLLGSLSSSSGALLFLTLQISVLINYQKFMQSRQLNKLDLVKHFTFIFICICFAFNNSSRSAILVGIVNIIITVALWFSLFNEKTIRNMYYIFLVAVVISLIGYIYITNAYWYSELNAISIQLFNKHIDSSRGALWMDGIQQLNGLKFFTGLGTGSLPTMARFLGSSYHNSFIQVLVQNGLIGLLLLLNIFRIIWKELIKLRDNRLRALVISSFFSVMLYNCFEVCLLQNKAFLGITNWMLLTICTKIVSELSIKRN